MPKKQQEAKREKQREAIIESLRKGSKRLPACRAAGVARRTFYVWLGEDDSFREAVEEAELEAVESVEAVAYKAAMKAETDPKYQTSMIFFLKAKAGWKETKRVEHDGSIKIDDARERLGERLAALAAEASTDADEGRAVEADT